MNASIIPRRQPESKADIRQARHYLAALATVANTASSSEDMREIQAALRVFAEPSAVLRRLAEKSRGWLYP